MLFISGVQILVLGLRLHFTKDSTIINTAAATVRQLVSSVFERVTAEDATPAPGTEVICNLLACLRLPDFIPCLSMAHETNLLCITSKMLFDCIPRTCCDSSNNLLRFFSSYNR